jgi:hypothetical protein
MLMDYIQNYIPDSVRHLYVNADNAAGTNKNKTILAFFSYLVAMGRFDAITYSFMIAGHKKSPVDGMFGMIKRRFLREDSCISPSDFVRIVEKCPRVVPRHADDVDWHDWGTFSGSI